MDPIKYAIKQSIILKCSNCKDLSFCKIPAMLQQIDKPDIRDLDAILKCLFYKRKTIELKPKLTTWL